MLPQDYMEVHQTYYCSFLFLNTINIGHYERKMKHLENQKEGKRRMKKIGTVDLPQEAFFDILGNKK